MDLRLKGHANIFAIGDVADLPVGRVASQAYYQGQKAAANIEALQKGKQLSDYTFTQAMQVVFFGPYVGFPVHVWAMRYICLFC